MTVCPRADEWSEYTAALMELPDHTEAMRWIVRRVAADLRGRVALVDVSGDVPRIVVGDLGDVQLPPLRSELRRGPEGRVAGVTLASEDGTLHVLRVGDGASDTVLAVADPLRSGGELWPTIARAASLIGVYLRAERVERIQRRLADLQVRVSDAVMDLLHVGHVSAAQQVAGVLRRELPDPIRFAVLEGLPRQSREEIRRNPATTLGSTIWAFRAKAQREVVLLLAPADDDGALDRVVGRMAAAGCRVGLSDVVPLREAGTGYEQALHALYAVPAAPGGNERFESRTKLAHALGPAVRVWADRLLGPLLSYEPPRRTAPDAEELIRTARAWLRLAYHAPRGLDIHRNTTRDRLRLIGQLLGADLSRVSDQAVVSLALRAHEQIPHGADVGHTGEIPSLAELLDRPEALAWAQRQLQPLAWHRSDIGLRTLRTWLDQDASIAATAVELGVSASAVRKRLLRVGRELGRSLLELPGSRHDLWLALLVSDRAAARAADQPGPPVPGIYQRRTAADGLGLRVASSG